MAVDVERCRTELDQLEVELQRWNVAPSPPGLSLWRDKLYTLIGDILTPNDALAIRLSGLQWTPGLATFQQAQRSAAGIIEKLRWELGRRAPTTDPFVAATIDPELWEHVRGLVEAKDWEKVVREAAVFVEDRLRTWAAVPASVTGSVNVFKAAIGRFPLPKAGPGPEKEGWQLLATGFALALRNPSGHRVSKRSDAERYALGVLGTASLLLTEIRHEYGDPPPP